MKLKTITLSFFLFFTLGAFAQNTWSVSGSATDTAAKAKLFDAVISVLNAKDSTLVNFTRAAKDGSFTVGKLHKGNFILLMTYPGYADYVEQFSLDSVKNNYNFGQVDMILKSKLLQDVIIKGTRAAIKIKGDTTEFNASAFAVQPNAKVEDLLKQLPGMQVDKNGKITAEGQEVKKVLVDGEEFFGDDPTLVTKNIRADMVDKVQVYDKKSDQATFTGIDDGKKEKTINIKLKEDKKNGSFGKVNAGVGTNDYYEGQGMFNAFKGKEKFAAYATVGNDGKIGLGWQDNQTYGASDNMMFGDNGEIFITAGGGGDGLDSFNGQYNGQGTPLTRNGGLHYDDKWDGDKQSVNTNYKIGSLEVTGLQNNQTQNSTSQGTFNNTSNENSDNYMFRQKLDVTYKLKLDTTSDLKLTASGTLRNAHTKNSYTSQSIRNLDTLLNNSARSVDNHDNTKMFDVSAFYTKKFHKKGRTLSFLADVNQKETDSYGYLKSKTNYFDPLKPGILDSTQYIDQYKTATVKNTEFKTNLTYTEPLIKNVTMVLNYGLDASNGNSNLASFNPNSAGVYNARVDSLSDNYKLNALSNQVGAIFNFKSKKVNLNFGTKVSNVNFDQTDEPINNQQQVSQLKRNFVDWFPQAEINYQLARQQNVSMFYSGSTVQPTIAQIQPTPINTDPLNIMIGNPNLTPSFTNRFGGYFNSYKVISGQYIWIYGHYSFTTNPIVSKLVTDSTGKTINQYTNLNSKKQSDYNLNAEFDQNVGKFRPGIGININGNNFYDLSNGEINYTHSVTYGLQAHLARSAEKKYDAYLNFGPSYTFSGSSLQPTINNNGRGFDADWGFTLYLPAKFQIGSDGSYEWRGKTETFNTDFNRTLINASIAKTFLKQDNLKLSLAANDLLNQNQGFSRNASGNYITQNSYSTIRRYFMFSISYDFSKMAGAPSK